MEPFTWPASSMKRHSKPLCALSRTIEGIDGNAVASQPRTGIERHESERLRAGGVDDLPDVDVETISGISAISLTRPIFTARKVFSSSFTATRVLATLMTLPTTFP